MLRAPLPTTLNYNLAIHSNDSFWIVQKDQASLSAVRLTTPRRPVQTGRLLSINGARRRSGGCAPKAIELTPGDLPRVVSGRLSRPRGRLTAGQKSADGIVGHDVGKASEALQSRKAEQQIGRTGNDGRRPERLRAASRTGNS